MNKRIKAQWIKALRSGDYVQGRGALRSEDNRYCCLGVLCELAVSAGVLSEADTSLDTGCYSYPLPDGSRETGTLPRPVQWWSGVESSTGRFIFAPGEAAALSQLNDGGCTFGQIADTIEREF
jgi:hypothetical protein